MVGTGGRFTAEDGFWRPDWYLVLEQGFEYPEAATHVDQYVVMEANGDYAIYRTWVQTFTVESITTELGRNGFVVELVGSDLRGSPLIKGSEMIGLVARKS